MRLRTKSVKFESSLDYVDYLTKGLPPKSEDATEAIKWFCADYAMDADDLEEIIEENDEEEISVIDADTVEEMLNEAYRNKQRSTNIAIGAGIAAGLLGILFGAFCINTPKKEEDKDD